MDRIVNTTITGISIDFTLIDGYYALITDPYSSVLADNPILLGTQFLTLSEFGAPVTIPITEGYEEQGESMIMGVPIHCRRANANWFLVETPDGFADGETELVIRGFPVKAFRFGGRWYLDMA